MTLQEIKEIARQRGLKVEGMKKKRDVIRAIQLDEGNRDCFMSEQVVACDEEACLWSKDCLK